MRPLSGRRLARKPVTELHVLLTGKQLLFLPPFPAVSVILPQEEDDSQDGDKRGKIEGVKSTIDNTIWIMKEIASWAVHLCTRRNARLQTSYIRSVLIFGSKEWAISAFRKN